MSRPGNHQADLNAAPQIVIADETNSLAVDRDCLAIALHRVSSRSLILHGELDEVFGGGLSR